MRCRKAQKYISRSVDGELAERENARLERHLTSCGECRALLGDMRKIVDRAATLDSPQPSDAVWQKVRAGLAAGTGRPTAKELAPERRPFFGMGVPAFRLAGAAAVGVFLIAGGVIIGLRLGRQDVTAPRKGGEAYTLAKLDEAEGYYKMAIASLSEAFAAGKGTLDPQVVELFDRNLSVIDATIQACRRAVLEEPDDLEARSYLLAAYTRKVTLLDSALDLERRTQGVAGGNRIL